MSYQFRINLTEEDFIEFNKYACWKASWKKRDRLLYALRIFFVVTVVFTATIVLLQQIQPLKIKSQSTLTIMGCIFIPLLCLYSYKQAPQELAKRSRNFIRKEENRHILDENIVTLDEAGIHCIDSRNDIMTRWAGIVRIAETRQYFYLFINELQGHIIPKSQLRDAKEIEAFNAFLALHVPLSVSFRSLEK